MTTIYFVMKTNESIQQMVLWSPVTVYRKRIEDDECRRLVTVTFTSNAMIINNDNW